MTRRLPKKTDQGADETLVADVRDRLRSTEMIDQRLRERLGEAPLPVSQVAASFHGRPPLAAEGRGGGN